MYRRAQVPRRRFTSENVTISLTVNQNTAHLNISNIGTFTIWCQFVSAFFTRLDIPTDVDIPQIVSAMTFVCTNMLALHTHIVYSQDVIKLLKLSMQHNIYLNLITKLPLCSISNCHEY